MNSNTATLMQNVFGAPSEVWTGEPALLDPVQKPQTNQRPQANKKLTIDISGELHIRIKVQAAATGRSIGELVRDMLEQRFPANR